MLIRDKVTFEGISLPESAYEVGDGFVVPLQFYPKTQYEKIGGDDESSTRRSAN